MGPGGTSWELFAVVAAVVVAVAVAVVVVVVVAHTLCGWLVWWRSGWRSRTHVAGWWSGCTAGRETEAGTVCRQAARLGQTQKSRCARRGGHRDLGRCSSRSWGPGWTDEND